VAWIEKTFEQRGLGFWAVEVIGEAPFVGFIGLAVPSFETHFTPCAEIGWRLAADYWNRGYATEGARAEQLGHLGHWAKALESWNAVSNIITMAGFAVAMRF
jgi:hypothetical protein